MDVRAFCPSCALARFGIWGQPVAPLGSTQYEAGRVSALLLSSARWLRDGGFAVKSGWPVPLFAC